MHGLDRLALALLEQDPTCISLTTADARTPLHVASEQGNDDLLQAFLERAASGKSSSLTLEAREKLGRTALHVAVECGNAHAVNLLVNAGACVDTPSKTGTTPISIAIENKWDEFAEKFTKLSNNLGATIEGRSLLHLAAEAGSCPWTSALIGVAKELIEGKDENGWMPIHHASHNGHAEIVQILLQSDSPVMPHDIKGWTPLHAAIKQRHLACATVLLKTKRTGELPLTDRDSAANQRSERRDQRSLLSSLPSSSKKYGVYLQRPESIDSAAIRDSGSSGRTTSVQKMPSPLYIAISESYEEAVELLMAHPLLTQGFFGNDFTRCCHKALYSDQPNSNIVKHLLSGAAIEAIFKLLNDATNPTSASSIAVLRHIWSSSYVYEILVPTAMTANQAACQCLLENWKLPEAGLKNDLIHKLSKQSVDTKDLRIESKLAPIIQLLAKNGAPLSNLNASGYTPLQACIKQHRYHVAHVFFQLGCRDSDLSKDGETALLVLLSSPGSEETEMRDLLDLLISMKADIHATDFNGQGVCHKIASARNSTHILNWLLERGARPDIQDKAGVTPIQIAVQSGFTAGLKSLLTSLKETKDLSRQLSIVDYSNPAKSPLMFAVENQDSDLLTCLVDFEKAVFTSIPSSDKEKLKPLRKILYTEVLCNAIHDQIWFGFDTILAGVSDVSFTNTAGYSPLHVAVRKDNKKQRGYYILALLKKGADVNAKMDAYGATPADLAYARDSPSTLALLLKNGAQPQTEYMTMAIVHQSLELAVALIESGSMLQAEHFELIKESTLQLPLTRFLLQHGAQLQPNHLDVAIKAGDSELLQKVLKAFPDDMDRQVSGLIVARTEHSSLVNILMKQVQNKLDNLIEQIEPDSAGGTILHSACRRKRVDQMKYIMASELGSHLLEAEDKVGYTALMAAINTFNWKCAEFLIRCGASTDEALKWVKKWPSYGWDTFTIIELARKGP